MHADGAKGLTDPTNEQTLEGATLRIRSTCGLSFARLNLCSLSYRVELPAGAAVVAHSDNGRVTADGLAGKVQLSSGDGRITANGPLGNLTLTSRNGRVLVTGATSAHLSASSGDDAVHVGFAEPPDSVNAQSRNGSVTVGLPHSEISYRVDAHSGNGRCPRPSAPTPPEAGRSPPCPEMAA